MMERVNDNLVIPDVSNFEETQEILKERNRKPMDIYCYMPIRCSIEKSIREVSGFSSMEELKIHVTQELLNYMKESSFVVDALDTDSPYVSHKESLFGCSVMVLSTIGNKSLDPPIRLGYWAVCTDKDFNDETRELKKYKKSYCNYMAKNRMEFLVAKLTYSMVYDYTAVIDRKNNMNDVAKGIYDIYKGNYSLDK